MAFNHSQLPNIFIRDIINRLPSVFFEDHKLHFYAASPRTPLPIRLYSAFVKPEHISLWQRDGYGGYVVTVWLPPFWAYLQQVPAFMPPIWTPFQQAAQNVHPNVCQSESISMTRLLVRFIAGSHLLLSRFALFSLQFI